ncbi:NUDIX hydrolase [Candidatus Shapirobacteria bacterium]|nr:NUDIX hydrolase [Candidatus Shapirobacteria bacterium]
MTQYLHHTVDGPAVAVDTTVFTISNGKLMVLMLKIKSGDYSGKWCLPGGLVALKESPESTAIRVLKDKTNIKSGYLEQLYTFGDPNRDSRGQVVSIAYLLLVRETVPFELNASGNYVEIDWQEVEKLPETAFDHKDIIAFAVTRLQSKLEYSNVAKVFLPESFSKEDIVAVYEIILNKKLKAEAALGKMLSSNVIVETGEGKYKFAKESINYFD